MDPLEAVGPVDGRYHKEVEELAPFWSERAFMRYRITVEGEYLIALSEHSEIDVRDFSEDEKKLIRNLYALSEGDAEIIKAIEVTGWKDIKATDHDLKSIEYFMREKLKGTSLGDSLEWIHFALTSEDTTNIAYALMLRDALEAVMLPALRNITRALRDLAMKNKGVPMLARTHGQPATPTTFGKEFVVFASRLERQIKNLENQKLSAKLNGATGNYNAHHVAYPSIDWKEFSRKFIESFNADHVITLAPNFLTTQIESHDSWSELFDTIKRVNTILIGFDQDMWRYVSDEWIAQKTAEGEVGSSTMPHKVNPLKFENSEGNLGVANALFHFFSSKFPISRLQRDLSDSTVERNFGVAFAHSLIGYRYLLKGLGRIAVNEAKVRAELERHPEVIAEAIQTILRREGVPMPYEKLKVLTRGREVTMEDMRAFIDSLDVSPEVKEQLRSITPANYVGIAEALAQEEHE